MTGRKSQDCVRATTAEPPEERVRKAKSAISKIVMQEFRGIGEQIVSENRFPPAYPCTKWRCEKRERYRKLLSETIREIEATRSSFRSKRLAQLRSRLENVLGALPPENIPDA